MTKSAREAERLRVFAERYCIHQNATEAAMEAAAAVRMKIPTRNAAGVWAKRNIDKPQVQAHIREIAQAVQAKAAEDAKISKASTVADVTEALTVLSAQMRGQKPWRLRISKQTYPVGGEMVTATQETRILEPGLAASRLLDHYDGVGIAPNDGPAVDIRAQLLIVLQDKEARRAFDGIAAKMLPVSVPPVRTIEVPSNGNGNGNGAGR